MELGKSVEEKIFVTTIIGTTIRYQRGTWGNIAECGKVLKILTINGKNIPSIIITMSDDGRMEFSRYNARISISKDLKIYNNDQTMQSGDFYEDLDACNEVFNLIGLRVVSIFGYNDEEEYVADEALANCYRNLIANNEIIPIRIWNKTIHRVQERYPLYTSKYIAEACIRAGLKSPYTN